MNYEVIKEPHSGLWNDPETHSIVQITEKRWLVFSWASIKVVKSGLTENDIKQLVDVLVTWQNR